MEIKLETVGGGGIEGEVIATGRWRVERGGARDEENIKYK